MTSPQTVTEIREIKKSALPLGVPAVPRNYKVFTDASGQIYTRAPTDNRKLRSRVPVEPMLFKLMTDAEMKTFSWEYAEKTYPTIPFREKMIHMGLKSEILYNMRMTAKAPKCSTILRQEYGMKGTPVSLYMQFSKFRGYVADPKIAQMALAEGEVA